MDLSQIHGRQDTYTVGNVEWISKNKNNEVTYLYEVGTSYQSLDSGSGIVRNDKNINILQETICDDINKEVIKITSNAKELEIDGGGAKRVYSFSYLENSLQDPMRHHDNPYISQS